MDRIIYGNALAPTSIVEYVDFNTERPYTLSIKSFSSDDISIPHYGESYEILICDNLSGSLVVSTERYFLSKQMAFIIPPKVVHSVAIKKCEGLLYVVKLSFKSLSHFININQILASCGKVPIVASNVIPDYTGILQCAQDLITFDQNPLLRLRTILSLFHCLEPCFLSASDTAPDQKTQPLLLRVIDWTEKNIGNPILVEDAAKLIGYNKYYFCHWFKANTSYTYGEYVQRIRVDHACHYLLEGRRISDVSHLCGYENTSYFIRIFSKYRNCTPKEYCQKYKS